MEFINQFDTTAVAAAKAVYGKSSHVSVDSAKII